MTAALITVSVIAGMVAGRKLYIYRKRSEENKRIRFSKRIEARRKSGKTPKVFTAGDDYA